MAATRPDLPVKGALLVAPADVDEAPLPPHSVSRFGSMPTRAFPFRAIVVASRNDPFTRNDRARVLSSMWEAQLDLADAGFSKFAPSAILITRRGYLNICKGLNDDRAWIACKR
jgi:predicted alpha/beta hydrolase family esterase